jgi:TetR/AcrR family transcriptional repressor of nem operon
MMAAKGFTAVGLNEILVPSGVPKGSFYHYFNSKEAYGEALIDSYFERVSCRDRQDARAAGQTMAQRLMTISPTGATPSRFSTAKASAWP